MIKMFTPLSVQLCLTGEKMKHRIEKSEAFQVVCKRKRVDNPQSGSATPDITAMWQTCIYAVFTSKGKMLDAFL